MPRRPRTFLPLALATAAAVLAPTTAGAATRSCPAKLHTLAKTSQGRVWQANGSLYGCTTVYGRKPTTRRLGPWRTGGKVAWEGSDAVWSVPLTRSGKVVGDRIYAADAEDGSRWLLGARALPAAEARTQRLFAWGTTGGWVTKDGSVVFAQRSPQEAPKAIGTLPAPPAAVGKLVLVGRWTSATPTDLGRTVKIDTTPGVGDGDECGGADEYRLTLAPDGPGGSERVGVSWWGSWERPFCG
jgi:hypothetical protein